MASPNNVTNSNDISSVFPPGESPQSGLRIFISGVNSLTGHSLFEEMRNDHIAIHSGETPHKFFGSVNEKDLQSVPVPSTTIKVLNSKTKPKSFTKLVSKCDIMILDLMAPSCDCGEAEFLIKSLKQQPEFQQERVLIVLSPPTTWAHTPKKLKKNFPRPKPEDSDMEEKKQLREDESDSENALVADGDKVLYYTDKDYGSRVPPPRY